MAQLRKILFSAFVYGALVMVCLGGVVWGLWYAIPSLLPVYYSSNEPVLEFPIDLLFHNFVMPFAVRLFKPGDSLHAMYTWWFRKCARCLRLTWFLFGERRIDEEGSLVLIPSSAHVRLPWWRTAFLEVKDDEVVPTAWDTILDDGDKLPMPPIDQAEFRTSAAAKLRLIESKQLIPSGRLVRAPASDQIKIPRGAPVFRGATDIDEATTRDATETLTPEHFSADGYQLVYLPPQFGRRVFLFILFIWLFAATTGVGLTIVPLVIGRRLFKLLIPPHIRTNDIYAFSIGIYVLGSAMYVVCHLGSMVAEARAWIAGAVSSWFVPSPPARLGAGILQIARLVYAYSILLAFLPLITAAIMELYIIIPLHTVMYQCGVKGSVAAAATIDGRHTVRVIQSWTLGILYLKLGARLVTDWYEDSQLAMAIEAVLGNGLLEPNLSVLTRVFAIPGATLGSVAVFGPLLAARMLLARGHLAPYVDNPEFVAVVHRLSYPTAALLLWMFWLVWKVVAVLNRWSEMIKDEAYLIGERLHNFSAITATTSPGRAKRAATDWRAGGNRL